MRKDNLRYSYPMLIMVLLFSGHCLAQADTSSRKRKEISIKGNRPLIRQEIDWISYDGQRQLPGTDQWQRTCDDVR